MTCTHCHKPFAYGELLKMDIETLEWRHAECSVYDVDDMRLTLAARYAACIRDEMDLAEAREFAQGYSTEGDVIIAHALGVLL